MGAPDISLPATLHSVFYAYTITTSNNSAAAGTEPTEIGSFEKFGQRSTRTVERIRNIFYSSGSRVIDMVWGGTDITLELSRVELYTQSLMAVFGISTPSLEHWNAFVDVHEIRTNTDGTVNTLTFKDCVASDFGKDLDTGTARVIETMTLQASYVMITATSGDGGAGANVTA
jgi:hypothetical protein